MDVAKRRWENIQAIQHSNNDSRYSNGRGIKAGDSVERLKKLYFEIQKVLDGRTDDQNCGNEYVDREKFLFLHFEVKDGKMVKIHIYNEIP